jgi:hypothetical protein
MDIEDAKISDLSSFGHQIYEKLKQWYEDIKIDRKWQKIPLTRTEAAYTSCSWLNNDAILQSEELPIKQIFSGKYPILERYILCVVETTSEERKKIISYSMLYDKTTTSDLILSVQKLSKYELEDILHKCAINGNIKGFSHALGIYKKTIEEDPRSKVEKIKFYLPKTTTRQLFKSALYANNPLICDIIVNFSIKEMKTFNVKDIKKEVHNSYYDEGIHVEFLPDKSAAYMISKYNSIVKLQKSMLKFNIYSLFSYNKSIIELLFRNFNDVILENNRSDITLLCYLASKLYEINNILSSLNVISIEAYKWLQDYPLSLAFITDYIIKNIKNYSWKGTSYETDKLTIIKAISKHLNKNNIKIVLNNIVNDNDSKSKEAILYITENCECKDFDSALYIIEHFRAHPYTSISDIDIIKALILWQNKNQNQTELKYTEEDYNMFISQTKNNFEIIKLFSYATSLDIIQILYKAIKYFDKTLAKQILNDNSIFISSNILLDLFEDCKCEDKEECCCWEIMPNIYERLLKTKEYDEDCLTNRLIDISIKNPSKNISEFIKKYIL